MPGRFYTLRAPPTIPIVFAIGVRPKRYQAALAKAGVEVQLRSTAGSVETAALLRDPHSGVSAGLMQGGVVGAANTAGVCTENLVLLI